MTTDDQIRDEKLQYGVNRETAKMSTLSSGKIRKYEYITGEDILLINILILLWEKFLKNK